MKAIWIMSIIILYLTLQHWLKDDNERKADFKEKKKRLREEVIDKRILFPNLTDRKDGSFWVLRIDLRDH